MSRACPPVGSSCCGTGGVLSGGAQFSSPPCNCAFQFGEVCFAKIPDVASILTAAAAGCTDPAGCCGGDIPFTFVTTAATPQGTQLAIPQATLNPVSSPGFAGSGNGCLRHSGPTAVFVVSFDVTITMVSSTATGTFPLITVFLCKNGEAIQCSAETAAMAQLALVSGIGPLALTESVHTFSGQALVRLQPGDQICVCIADLINPAFAGPTVVNPVDNICISQFSLIADQAS